MKRLIQSTLLLLLPVLTYSQHSVARQWNEILLESIRNDFARPTVHARNLFHISAAMYDSWAVLDDTALPYFLGRTINGFHIPFEGIEYEVSKQVAREEILSYACYRLIRHRFSQSPGAEKIYFKADSLMDRLGYDKTNISFDYEGGSPAELGNYLAKSIIEYGLQDGSNEQNSYANLYYEPVNPPLVVDDPGNPNMEKPNRWQPLTLETFIDQSGNEIPGSTPPFLSPEWGNVDPFSLSDDQYTSHSRNSNEFKVYLDPGDPPYLGQSSGEYYKWGFSLVSIWSSHLDPSDGVMWDISPKSIGNISTLPESFETYSDFYDLIDGGDASQGHSTNPITGQPYEEQIVPRGDYTRVLAEFWADGPSSETPPGHWFTILNYVNDHPLHVRKIGGQGEIVSKLEWDVKSYFLLGGTMHDVAVTSWGIKGWYDYVRPISAIRYMCDKGQSTDDALPNYSEIGIPLVEGLIELVEEGDELAGDENENVNKIKLYAWRGPDYISDPEVDEAGVGWILAENWWPYQRPSFVTPPFAGFVSGHSTYSQAAANVLSLLTGSEYFPGGLGEFEAPQNEFLVFEEGPSVDVVLQWATYKDAADQCSLSRIWGGIHPPADDIPGRKIGKLIGVQSYEFASNYFDGIVTSTNSEKPILIYPNPARDYINIEGIGSEYSIRIYDINGNIHFDSTVKNELNYRLNIETFPQGVYLMQIISPSTQKVFRFIK
ncbi:MAG: T9SS type A sorting domain-containing protein [Ekhidna sp.]|uniref:T9SS type A sorting domain-containing protein n=1 Tax=Ekhidna sp. TaxID=2608089 RepID=UPI0032F0174D